MSVVRSHGERNDEQDLKRGADKTLGGGGGQVSWKDDPRTVMQPYQRLGAGWRPLKTPKIMVQPKIKSWGVRVASRKPRG